MTQTALRCAALLSIGAATASAQTFPLTPADLADSAALATSMPRLAAQVLAAYRDTNQVRFLDNRFRLQLLTARYAEASASLAELNRVRQDTTAHTRAWYVRYDIFAEAKARTAGSSAAFPGRFAEVFRERFGRLDNRTAALAARSILVPPRTVANDLWWATPDQTGKTTVPMDEALTLLRIYSSVDSYRAFAGLPAALVAEDDARRYSIERSVSVKTPGGATVCAIVVRPRNTAARLPALLQFTIYADSVASMRDALLAASNGYVGVTGFTRGKACSPDQTVPYVFDGVDAAALIDWIAAQPWSDGRVGMFGGSYSGFTAWAAAKQKPAALKAIMVGSPVAPGIDVPMEGNIFWNFVYPWTFYTGNNRWLDNPTYNDNGRWNRLYRQWYSSGRPFRELEAIDGTPNPGFAEWLAHPTVDAWWRGMVPDGAEYAGITIPVLQTAGYFYGGPGGAVHYFQEHTRHNPGARHYLLIGPYDHLQAQRGVVTALGDTATYLSGYEIDPVAQIDIVAELRYQWFDHTMKGAPLPPLLQDRVNYQVMGANVWKHAPTIAAAADGRMRMQFKPVEQIVNLADRSDVDARPAGGGLIGTAIDTANAFTLVGEPLPEPVEVSGLLSGHLEFVSNKRDFDFSITLYELRASGEYFQLPPYTSRASHVGSATERRLLTPGQVMRLDFTGTIRMMSVRLERGSRLVMVLGILKNQRQQINYGTGKNVSEESIADAGEPLRIKWLPASYIELPTRGIR